MAKISQQTDDKKEKLEAVKMALAQIEKDFGKGHIRYAWQEEKKGKKIEQEYLPKNLLGKKYYQKD